MAISGGFSGRGCRWCQFASVGPFPGASVSRAASTAGLDLEGAEREIQAAFGMVPPLDHPLVLGTLSALRLAQGRAEEALATAGDAASRCAAMGGCTMFRAAFVRLAHVEALHATGAHDAARHAVAEARTRLFTIAGRIADPALKKSFLENVPENARTLALASAWLGEPPLNA